MQTSGLPGHRSGDGGIAKGRQKPGESDVLSNNGVWEAQVYSCCDSEEGLEEVSFFVR